MEHQAPKMTPLELRRVALSTLIRLHSCQRNRRCPVKYLGHIPSTASLQSTIHFAKSRASLLHSSLDVRPPRLTSWHQLQLVGFPLSRLSERLSSTASDPEGITTMSKEATGTLESTFDCLLLIFFQVNRHAYIDAHVAMGEIPGFKNKLGHQCSGLFLRGD
jgi:hypothetical protein